MNRRSMVIIGILLLLGAAATVAISPRLYSYYWKWRTQPEEIPQAGASVSYRDYGKGSPAVVIISGMAVPKNNYLPIQWQLAKKTRVLSFDRPGIGDSTPNKEPRTLDYIDKDIKALLQSRGVPPPYILVGHSLGGAIIRYYAAHHPGEVAGLVFLEAPHEDWFNYIRATWTQEEAAAYFKWWTAENKDYVGTRLEELLAYEANCDMIRGVGIPPDVPVLMFTGSNALHFRKSPAGAEEDLRNWVRLQASLLADVKDKKHIVDSTFNHYPHQTKPDVVVAEIGAFVDKVRGLQ